MYFCDWNVGLIVHDTHAAHHRFRHSVAPMCMWRETRIAFFMCTVSHGNMPTCLPLAYNFLSVPQIIHLQYFIKKICRNC